MSEKLEKIRKYHNFLNEVIALFSFGIGLQCLSLPEVNFFGYILGRKFFAGISAVFVFIVMAEPMRKIKSDYDELGRNHAYTDSIFLLIKGFPFIAAFLFLVLIAFGKIG
ncbi:MAG: hypothetical protein M0Z70_05825 [Nitrospiraceae bacterium]|nr:hypothetical protein [Nitrospiraceae bacterium]